jgi:hypothetical protein
MENRCYATTAREKAIQQPLLSNGFINKHFARHQLETAAEVPCVLYRPCREGISRKVSQVDSSQETNPPSRQGRCYIRTMAARARLQKKKSLTVSLKALGAKTN